MKLTKIVATIGPATDSESQLQALIEAGMNMARFNTKHADPAWHNERIERVKKIAREMDQPIAVLLDLQGPEIRINLPGGQAFEVEEGGQVTFTSDTTATTAKTVIVPQPVIESEAVGNTIILADGACELEVTSINGNSMTAVAKIACTIEHRKTMNTPGVVLSMPSLTDRDYDYLNTVKPEMVDYVGLSFVRNKEDIFILREELAKRNYTARIIAKIENQEAIDNLDEIIEVSDAIMVARGDLGVEVPYQELTYWQKTMIDKCRAAAKPVITATEMLKSMIDKPRPTRAEVSDVAHAIYDGTDAVMLSEETTMGKYPVKAVTVQATIAEFNESKVSLSDPMVVMNTTEQAITEAAMAVLDHSALAISKIICITETGLTAQLLSRFRPLVPIYALTSNRQTYYALALSYGVQPVFWDRPENGEMGVEELLNLCLAEQVARSGENILLVRGKLERVAGFTNTVSIITVP